MKQEYYKKALSYYNLDNYRNYNELEEEKEKLDSEIKIFKPNIQSEFKAENKYDLEEDKDYIKIKSDKVDCTQKIINDITSEIDNQRLDELSDCTSMTSSSSFSNMKDRFRNEISPIKSENSHLFDAKKLYQDFVKAVLKVKFEKIHSSHKGQNIPEKALFRECLKRNIPENEWTEFIINELKYPEKYSETFKSNVKKMKVQKSNK